MWTKLNHCEQTGYTMSRCVITWGQNLRPELETRTWDQFLRPETWEQFWTWDHFLSPDTWDQFLTLDQNLRSVFETKHLKPELETRHLNLRPELETRHMVTRIWNQTLRPKLETRTWDQILNWIKCKFRFKVLVSKTGL